LGYSLDEALGKDYLSTFVPERDRKFLARTFKKLVRSKQPTLDETYVLTKDGREILIEWRARPIFKTSGELDFFFGVGIDITERKRLEEQLRQSEARYRAVVEDQTELICRFAPDGTITFVNDAYCRYLGKSRDALQGHNFLETIPAQYRETTQQHLAMLNRQKAVATRECKIVLPNGETQWQQWTDRAIFNQSADSALETDQTPQIVEFQSIGRDITERRRSEQETARLASLALLSPNPIIETDLAGNIRYLNPEAMRLFPTLEDVGAEHPFLSGVAFLTTALKRQGSLRREVKIDKVYYEQVLHYLAEIDCLRIYAFDITERKQAEAQIIRNAFYDPLTGLANRALYMDRLRQAVRRAKQHRKSLIASQPYQFAVLFLNLNRFKVVNDSLGNQWGDQLLRDFAHRLQTCLRPTDTVARLGGDEFAILLEGIQDVGDATRVADAIEQTLNTPFVLSGSDVFMTVSIGIAMNTTRKMSDLPMIAASGESTDNLSDSTALVPLPEEVVLQPEDLLRNADIAMYRARSQGAMCYEVFDSAMHRQALDQLRLETDLRRAIERQEFQVYYQPIVSLFTGRITGFEALIRWQHPQRGLVSPNEFIPIAEETGLIAHIGRWTLQESCRQLSLWQREFPNVRPLTINVNLSCKQFTQPDLLAQIDQILQETDLAVGSLKLEITESVVMDNPDAVKGILLQLSERKIKLCIDDFGTGYSSLSRLQHFPISTLKIDRSFVSQIGALGENSEIVQAIVTLAQTLSMDVVAEGIEVSEQVSPLIALQCEYGQGYFFSKPLDSEGASELLRKESQKRGMKK
ncbi:MAG TPA: EAL domain-containing protein, partial [Cyanophyceae cyanobacterium]